ncbi:hypothetical protein LSAT2_031362 [Lamellibrachia satsuma]|nr:hypothetical protein LSAT2_031362 [Lamellibrachia satsuma]
MGCTARSSQSTNKANTQTTNTIVVIIIPNTKLQWNATLITTVSITTINTTNKVISTNVITIPSDGDIDDGGFIGEGGGEDEVDYDMHCGSENSGEELLSVGLYDCAVCWVRYGLWGRYGYPLINVVVVIRNANNDTLNANNDIRNANNDTRNANNDTRKTNNGTRNANNDTRNANNDTRNANNDTRSTNNNTRNANNDTRNANNDIRNANNDTRNAKNDTRNANNDTRNANNDTRKTSRTSYLPVKKMKVLVLVSEPDFHVKKMKVLVLVGVIVLLLTANAEEIEDTFHKIELRPCLNRCEFQYKWCYGTCYGKDDYQDTLVDCVDECGMETIRCTDYCYGDK